MAVLLQIPDVPTAVHRRLKARAELAGLKLSDFLLLEIKRSAAQPTTEELAARLRRRRSVRPTASPVEILRAGRDIR